jgi:site-specific DNA recombinase
MSEESRLEREAIETAYTLKQLITAGVRVFFYLEDRERTFDSPTDKLLMSVTAFADELERQKAGLRVHDAMSRKARAGHLTGGRMFGYDNLEMLDASGQRSHVERRINEAEAAAARSVAARGAGTRGIMAASRCGSTVVRPTRSVAPASVATAWWPGRQRSTPRCSPRSPRTCSGRL